MLSTVPAIYALVDVPYTMYFTWWTIGPVTIIGTGDGLGVWVATGSGLGEGLGEGLAVGSVTVVTSFGIEVGIGPEHETNIIDKITNNVFIFSYLEINRYHNTKVVN